MAMTLRLDESREANLRAVAQEEERSMHAVILSAIDEYVERHESTRFVALADDVIARHAELLNRLAQ